LQDNKSLVYYKVRQAPSLIINQNISFASTYFDTVLFIQTVQLGSLLF